MYKIETREYLINQIYFIEQLEGGNERENEKGKVDGKTKAKKKEKSKKTKGELKIKTKGPEELTQHWIKPMFKEKKGKEDRLSLAISYGEE